MPYLLATNQDSAFFLKTQSLANQHLLTNNVVKGETQPGNISFFYLRGFAD